MVVLELGHRDAVLSEQGARPAQDGEIVSLGVDLDQRETGDTGLLGVRIQRGRDHAFLCRRVCAGTGYREFVPAAGATTWNSEVPCRSLSAVLLRLAGVPSSACASRAKARESGSKACSRRSVSRPAFDAAASIDSDHRPTLAPTSAT